MRFFIWIFIFSFVLVGFKVGDPDPYNELTSIIKAYRQAQNLQTEIQYYYYDNLDARTPSDSITAFFHKKGDDYYFRTDDVEILQKGKANLVISYEEEIIQYAEAKKKSQFLFDLESFQETAIQKGLKIEFIDKGSGKGLLRYSANEHSKSQMMMEYDRNNYFLISSDLKVSIPKESGYSTGFNDSRIKIEYANTSTKSKPFLYQFEDYITKKGGKIYPKSAYKSYQIYN